MCSETLTENEILFCDYVRVVSVVIFYACDAVPGRFKHSVVQFDCVTVFEVKHCSAKLPLRLGLIHAAKMHEYLVSLISAYVPCP